MITSKSFFGRTEISSRNFAEALRRDAMFVWNVVVSVVFVAFAALAVASAVLDLVAVRH